MVALDDFPVREPVCQRAYTCFRLRTRSGATGYGECSYISPADLSWVEEPCPPENVGAMARIARRVQTPFATGERLVASYGVRELVEQAVVDIIQTGMNHVGGITAIYGSVAEW